MAERLRPHAVDVALLPDQRPGCGNMDGADAARLAHAIGARCAIPCHYDMFAFNTADRRTSSSGECERLGQPYRVLRTGERLSFRARSGGGT